MIYDITPFTTMDYPGELACIIWLSGCNMRCVYCYNKDIVMARADARAASLDLKRFQDFLNSRLGLIDAVVYSGGECTSSPLLLTLARYSKSKGLLNKFDTNGSNPKVIEQILNEGLASFVSLDFKATREKFKCVAGADFYDNFMISLSMLLRSGISFEVRTTIHFDLLDEKDILSMANDLINNGYEGIYYLQKFLDTGSNIGGLTSAINKFNVKEVREMVEKMSGGTLKIALRNF